MSKVRHLNVLHPAAKRVQAALKVHEFVVNAPRPLAGDETWEGDFISGRYYAAGTSEEYGDYWNKYGAVYLNLVTNAEVLQAIINSYQSHRYKKNLRGLIKKRGHRLIKDLGISIDLPYVVDESVSVEEMLNAANWEGYES